MSANIRNEYHNSDLDGFQNPYELEYSTSVKDQQHQHQHQSSLIKSQKVPFNKILPSNNNNINNNNNNLQFIQQKEEEEEEKNKNNFKKNYPLSLNITSNINKMNIPNVNNNNLYNYSCNNFNSFSSTNAYWEKRERQNKLKMKEIKKEREKKIYGEMYQKPKISKGSEEIIKKIRDKSFDIIKFSGDSYGEDFQQEDEINRNIPIRIQQSKNFFKTNNLIQKIKYLNNANNTNKNLNN